MIPKGLTKAHFLQAAASIDSSEVPRQRRFRRYALVLNGERYPLKYIISLANRYSGGGEHPYGRFNAVEAKNYFLARGYEIWDRQAGSKVLIAAEDDESKYPEGRKRYKLHRQLERDSSITRKAKAKRLEETGKLECEVCAIDFFRKYGELGRGFIEAHHTRPVSGLDGSERTKLADIALVCPNCHHMLHRGALLLTIAELKTIICSPQAPAQPPR